MASRSGELGDLPSRLERVFAKFPGISAVYLFGSRALGSARPESDLDLAVVSESPDARAYRLDLLAELAKEGLDNVDLVFLDTADVVLRFEAVRPNRPIYARIGFDHGSYYSKALRQYPVPDPQRRIRVFDFLPRLNTQREAYKRRILQDDQA